MDDCRTVAITLPGFRVLIIGHSSIVAKYPLSCIFATLESHKLVPLALHFGNEVLDKRSSWFSYQLVDQDVQCCGFMKEYFVSVRLILNSK